MITDIKVVQSWTVSKDYFDLFYRYIKKNYPDYSWDGYTKKDAKSYNELGDTVFYLEEVLEIKNTQRFFIWCNISDYCEWGYDKQSKPMDFKLYARDKKLEELGI